MPEHQVITDDGLRLHATAHGRADALVSVLLAHCWTADEADWHYQVTDLLARYGHDVRVITWDHRGHGRSDRAPEDACTVPLLARDLGRIADTLAPGGRLVVAGHSIGGIAITAIPDERPDLMARLASGELGTVTLGLPAIAGRLMRDRLPFVLANRARMLSLSRREKSPTIERQIAQRFLFGRPARPRDVGLVVGPLMHTSPATMGGFFRAMMRHDRVGSLGAFDVIPTTVLVGCRDVLTPPEHGATITRGIRGARLLVAPDAGHYLPFERRELVSTELAVLVDRALARTGAVTPAGARPGRRLPPPAPGTS